MQGCSGYCSFSDRPDIFKTFVAKYLFQKVYSYNSKCIKHHDLEYYIQIVLSSVFLTIRCMGVRSYVQDSENLTNYAYSSLYFCFCRQLRYIKESALWRKFPTSKNFLKDPLTYTLLSKCFSTFPLPHP